MTTEALIDRLYKMISDGRFPKQSKLPPERELAKVLNVTRARLRKALALLEADGKIWRHVGKGTYVGNPPTDQSLHLSCLTQSTNPMEIMEVRMVIEPKLAGFAAMRATPAMIAEMHRCMEKSAAAADIRTFELWDTTLHRTIAEAAHNSLLFSVINIVNAMRQDKLWGQLKESAVTPERMTVYSGQHHDCIKAIEARNITAAERSMTEHLERVRSDLLSVTAGFEKTG